MENLDTNLFWSGIRLLEKNLKSIPERNETKLKTTDARIEQVLAELAQLGISAEDTLKKQKLKNELFNLNYLKENQFATSAESRYGIFNTLPFYLMKRVNSPILADFYKATEFQDFWSEDYLFDDPHVLWYLKNLNVNNSYFIKNIDLLLKKQNVEGYIQSNDFDHTGPLRTLISIMPNSKPAISALNYWIENWEEYSERAGSLAVGVLALTEFDYEYFSKYIKEMTVGLEQLQEEEGSWKKYGFSTAGDIEITSLAIAAISRTNGTTDSKCQKALEWIKRQKMELDERQKTDDDWIFQTYTYPIDAAWILLALSTMGQGLMVSKDLVEYQIMQMNQTHLKAKPIFVQTSPIYHSSLHVKEINDKIVNMIQKAKNELRISSPFIDMYYEDIINKIQENPNLMVRLITRPKGEIKGLREKIANNVIDMLNTVTRGNVIQSRTVHSRMVIVDDNELLVSSADLTRDQLFDEFNAGIWTTDKEAIKRAVDFFDNIFQLETQSKQNT